jgi:enamine deaminase RidA (YjgF/YER057c/UK114 family)
MANASAENQTRVVLVANELTMDTIISTTVFLKDMNEFTKTNDVYE